MTNNEYQVLLAQEEFILGATELIFELMEKTGVTKAELARRVGRTRGYLTQVLDGNRNMTLRTLAELTTALGYRPRLDAELRAAKRRALAIERTGQKKLIATIRAGREPRRVTGIISADLIRDDRER